MSPSETSRQAGQNFPRLAPPFTGGSAFHDTICEKLDARLSVQRIWQDLGEDFGYGASYESIKRYVRTLPTTRRAVGVFVCGPGEEGQVDFFRGAPTLEATTGQWNRPWAFRLTLSHSRHGYEEAVWDQRLETFLRLHERAFRDLGGVPRVIRHDNQAAAVVRACLYDPDTHAVYAAFAQHWGFTPLPIQPRRPQQNGKQERSGGYVKDNALKGRRFDSLDAQNAHLRHWNRTIARLRIHGTTRRQVWTHFVETEQTGVAAAGRHALCDLQERHADGPPGRARRSRRCLLSRAGRAPRARRPGRVGRRAGPRVPRRHAGRRPRARPGGDLRADARRGRRGPDHAATRLRRAPARAVRAGRPAAAPVGRGGDHGARRPRDSPHSRRARPHPASIRASACCTPPRSP